VTIKGVRTILDYAAFREENKKASMDIGVMTIVFGQRGQSIVRVEWQYPGREGKEVNVTGSLSAPPDPGSYKGQRGKLRRTFTLTVRGAQGRFRVLARATYGDKCAISGCDISEALEAVHIDPYENSSQHHPCNALLLRKDLHALFDASLIAINPKTGRAEFASSLRRYKQYATLHKKRVARPVGGYELYAPDKNAILRRWKIWLENVETNAMA
jgi:hypothetical protein